ncbi:MAG TPA: carboxypeptidase regulatory-like domain-containing protein [Terriglobia bacterium]|nr:carboxypeptidase regulatory-like domain-containing protein [Terriglobia bacterium]
MRIKWTSVRRLGFLLMAIVTISINAAAQTNSNIVGTVRDASGAVIPGATVTVTNPAIGFVRHLVTDSAGSYSVSSVPIGTYEVTFQAKGFIKVVQQGVTLTVGQTQRVDATMKVGTVTQEVTVQGNLPHVQTETAAISGVVTGKQIENLNINGRNFVQLALLVPGAAPSNDLQTSTVGVAANNNISFNGSRTQYNNWEVDGAPNTDEGSASTFNTYPNLDSIAEFRISTSNYGAQYGHHSGATIEVATKSGTKQFHGTVFEFLRNDALDANDWFVNGNTTGVANAPKTPLKQNEYGFIIGGPVFIPGLYNTHKTKTFFFYSEDWRRIRTGNVLNNDVPSLLERQGDFSECDPTSGNFNQVVASGCVLPTVNGVTYNNVNAVPGINPQDITNARNLLDALVPLPNGGPVGWTKASPSNTDWREDQIRVDQNINDKTTYSSVSPTTHGIPFRFLRSGLAQAMTRSRLPLLAQAKARF